MYMHRICCAIHLLSKWPISATAQILSCFRFVLWFVSDFKIKCRLSFAYILRNILSWNLISLQYLIRPIKLRAVLCWVFHFLARCPLSRGLQSINKVFANKKVVLLCTYLFSSASRWRTTVLFCPRIFFDVLF